MNWKACFNIKRAVLIMLLLHVVISPAFAEVKTFEKKYTYRASGLDNEASSTAIGRAQAEGLLYSDLGNYLIEHTEAKLFRLGPREIRTLAPVHTPFWYKPSWQHLWLVVSDDVYQRFTCVSHTIRP